MARVFAKDPEAKGLRCYYWPIKGGSRHLLTNAEGFDTVEKWVEICLFNDPRKENGPRFLAADGRILRARIYINYDIVEEDTGKVVYSVRQ